MGGRGPAAPAQQSGGGKAVVGGEGWTKREGRASGRKTKREGEGEAGVRDSKCAIYLCACASASVRARARVCACASCCFAPDGGGVDVVVVLGGSGVPRWYGYIVTIYMRMDANTRIFE